MTTEATSSASPVELIVPLQRVLAAHGHELSSWAIVEACRGDFSLNGFAHCAREQGLEANVLSLLAGDLSYIRVGAIVEFDDESMATVVAHYPRGVEVENNDRARWLVTADDETVPLRALEVGTATTNITFFARLMDRVRTEPHVGRAVAFALFLSVVMAALGLAGPR